MIKRTWTTDLREARQSLIRRLKQELDFLTLIVSERQVPSFFPTDTHENIPVHTHEIRDELENGCLSCLIDVLKRHNLEFEEADHESLFEELVFLITRKLNTMRFPDLDDDSLFYDLEVEAVSIKKKSQVPSVSKKSTEVRKSISDARTPVSTQTYIHTETYEGNKEYQLRTLRGRVGSGHVIGDGKINLDNEIYFEESLPFQWVHYPPLYGCFPPFATSESGSWVICSCQRNVLQVLQQKGAQLDRLVAVGAFSQIVNSSHTFRWENSICHRCLKVLPEVGTFPHQPSSVAPNLRDQEPFKLETPPRWGMYVQIAMYEVGIKPTEPSFILRREHFPWAANHHWNFTIDEISTSIRPLADKVFEADEKLDQTLDATHQPFDASMEKDQITEIRKRPRESRLELRRYIENQVREHFGVKPIGATGKTETALYEIVRDLFPGVIVERNVRPAWLKGLEIDIWIPALKLAIEYQGQQHFMAIDHWGGESKLLEQQKRDIAKRKLCALHGVYLVEFLYNETVNSALVKSRLEAFLSN